MALNLCGRLGTWQGGGKGRGKEWEQRGSKPERRESKEGGRKRVVAWRAPKKARVKGFTMVEGCGKPGQRVYWWPWLGWGVPVHQRGVCVFGSIWEHLGDG